MSIFFCFADVSIDMPDLLDISHLRARGLQPGEEELPDISPPIVIPDDSKGTIFCWKDAHCLPPSSSRGSHYSIVILDDSEGTIFYWKGAHCLPPSSSHG